MAVIKAPDDYGISSYSLECDSCHAGATLSHCGRCGNGIYFNLQPELKDVLIAFRDRNEEEGQFLGLCYLCQRLQWPDSLL